MPAITHKFGIDWLRVTMPVSPQQCIHWGEAVTADFKHLPSGGLHGYEKTERWEKHPTVVAWSEKRTDMKTMLEFTGQSLARARSVGVDVRENILDWHEQTHVNCTRIDLCLDLFGERLTRLTRKADRWNRLGLDRGGRWDSKGGQSEYVGASASERMLTIYNKGAKEGTAHEWFRLEFRLSGMRAKNTMGAIVRGESLEKIFLGHWLTHMGEKSLTMLKKSLYITTEELDVGGRTRKPTDTEKWLLETVAKSLARVCAENPAFYGEFLATLDANGRALGYVKEGFDIG